jgi:hypothetical protein
MVVELGLTYTEDVSEDSYEENIYLRERKLHIYELRNLYSFQNFICKIV